MRVMGGSGLHQAVKSYLEHAHAISIPHAHRFPPLGALGALGLFGPIGIMLGDACDAIRHARLGFRR